MALFQVHPHFGYLNSDVLLINGSDAPLLVKDSNDGKNYTIPASSKHRTWLNAGEHKFIVVGDESVSETVVVEDAIKLGGSKDKKVYIFEGTPWVLWVMLDRTYFYNRNTNEEYIEHCLTPNNIKFLTPNYLLFITDKDNSLFSLDNLSVEKTIGDSTFLFSNEHYAVFTSPGGLSLYSFENKEEKLVSIKCNGYAIDKTNQILYYHIKGEKQILIKQLCDLTITDSSYKLPETFRCFIGEQSVIIGNNPQTLYILNPNSKKSAKLYDDFMPITMVNDQEIWKNSAADLIKEKETLNSFTSYVELTVYERGNRWFFIQKVTHLLKNCGAEKKIEKQTMWVTGENNAIIDSAQQLLTVTRGKSFDCVQTSLTEKGVLVFDDVIEEYEGKPIVSPNGYILIAKKNTDDSSMILEDPLNTSYKSYRADQEIIDIFQKTGLIKESSAHKSNGREGHALFHDSESQKVFDDTIYDSLNIDGFFRFSSRDGDYILSQTREIRPMPCLKDRLIAVSEHCNYAIIRSEEGIALLQYNPDQRKWTDSTLSIMHIDTSFYCRAVFSADGENIIYQKKGGKAFYIHSLLPKAGVETCENTKDDPEFEFEGSSTMRFVNGYLPYIDSNSYRRPVYVDPVSLKRVEPIELGLFVFQSPSKTIQHIKEDSKSRDSLIECINYENRVILEADYNKLKALYDYSWTLSEDIRNNRIKYYASHKALIRDILGLERRYGRHLLDSFCDDKCQKEIMVYSTFCDHFIIKEKKHYIRMKINCGTNEEKVIKIPIPDELHYINHISYSYDERYFIVAGRFQKESEYKGLALVYDVKAQKVIYKSLYTMAVWLGVFSKNGMVAYYDSVPNTYISDSNMKSFQTIHNRSFLTFSPTGKYIALSRQGYIPYDPNNPHWGHQPSRDVYIARSDSPCKELAHYCDHGDSIEGLSELHANRDNHFVASATFSKDEKKIMTVSDDGVVVIRNLHLEKNL